MENQRKWTGWLLISAIVLVVGITLVMTTLASPQPDTYPQTQTTQQPSPATQAPAPSAQPALSNSRTANASIIGYGGPVLVRLTLDENDAIEALEIGGARFEETQGVGSKVKDDAFTQALIGKKPPLTLAKDADSVSGATISSTAAVEAINAAYAFLTEETSSSGNK